MYNRFHNYVADTLLKINEYGRFTIPNTNTEEQKREALKKQDNDLFQTARLIVGGLYINICLHDYLRGLTNTHHSDSSWTLDPRVDVDRMFDSEGVPKGCGNQVSAEFNLLYRFHSTISLRDEKWTNDFMQSLFPGLSKSFDQLTPMEFVQGLFRFEQSIPKDPEKREFGGIKRGTDGRFDDADLVDILKSSMEDPAGLFGPRMVPKALKMVEIAGILSARRWQLASLNECRDFFGLKRHETFEDINPDPAIADLMRKFYHHPDMVEIYPGLFLEDGKPRLDPGCGGCPPYTVGRAVFSDAITLVRSDRFYTLDYTVSTLTNWGMREVQQDLRVLGGSMFYKLIQRGLPDWFPYNSLHAMQPMYTRKMNEQIAREIGTIDLYTTADPAPPRGSVTVTKLSTITIVLSDSKRFKVPRIENSDNSLKGRRNVSDDHTVSSGQGVMVENLLKAAPELLKLIHDTTWSLANELVNAKTMSMSAKIQQLDIIRDVAIPLNARIMSDLWYLDLKSAHNPTGSLNTADMYKHLINARTWTFENFDPAMAWQRRMWAQDAVGVLGESTKKAISVLIGSGHTHSLSSTNIVHKILSRLFSWNTANSATTDLPKDTSLRGLGAKLIKGMVSAGIILDDIVATNWSIAMSGSGPTVGVFVDVLSFFLKPNNAGLWATVIDLSTTASGDVAHPANQQMRRYVLEALRLTSHERDVRICQEDMILDGIKMKKGDRVITALGMAGRLAENVTNPEAFLLDRPIEIYRHSRSETYRYIEREIAIATTVALIKVTANLKCLRPAPGNMGLLKCIEQGTERYYLNESWSYLTTHPTTWTVHYEGFGKGVYQPPSTSTTAGQNLGELFTALKEEAKKNEPVPPSGPKTVSKDEPYKRVETQQSESKIEQSGPYKVQQGTFTPSIPSVAESKPRTFEQKIEFKTSFSTPPRMLVGIQQLDIDFLESAPNISVEAKDVTTSGFTLVVQTESRNVWSLIVSWMAIPAEGGFKDAITMVFDSRKGKNTTVSEVDGRKTVMQSFDFADVQGSKYQWAPKAVTWLSGLQLAQSPSISNTAFRLRGYVANSDNKSGTVAIETNQAAVLRGAQVNVLFMPVESPLIANYINPEDTIVIKPLANSTNSEYQPQGKIDKSKTMQSVIALEGWDFSTVGGSSIRCSVKTAEKSTQESSPTWDVTQSCWYDCKVNGIWSWAITTEQ